MHPNTKNATFFIKFPHRYWSPVGSPIGVTHTGSHKRITAYGSTTADGRQFFRTYEKFDAPTFARYLKEMQRHFGKVAVVVDRAPPHKAKAVRRLLREMYYMKSRSATHVHPSPSISGRSS